MFLFYINIKKKTLMQLDLSNVNKIEFHVTEKSKRFKKTILKIVVLSDNHTIIFLSKSFKIEQNFHDLKNI